MAFLHQMMFCVVLVLFTSQIESIKTDYYQIVFQWPRSVCIKSTCNPSSTGPTLKSFTLHGVWPDDTTATKTPQNVQQTPQNVQNNNQNKKRKRQGPPPPPQCKPTYKYTGPRDQAQRATLNTIWPNVKDTTNNQSFWEHEWDTHGNCYVAPRDQGQYFDFAIKLFRAADINSVLFSNGLKIGATNTLNVSRHIETSTKIKVIPIVKFYDKPAVQNNQPSVKYLVEVVICHNGTDLINCPLNRRSPKHVYPIKPFSYELP